MSTYDFEPDPSDYGPEPAHIANPGKVAQASDVENLRRNAFRKINDLADRKYAETEQLREQVRREQMHNQTHTDVIALQKAAMRLALEVMGGYQRKHNDWSTFAEAIAALETQLNQKE